MSIDKQKCVGCRKMTNWLTLTWRDGLQYCKKCIEHIWRQEKENKQQDKLTELE